MKKCYTCIEWSYETQMVGLDFVDDLTIISDRKQSAEKKQVHFPQQLENYDAKLI